MILFKLELMYLIYVRVCVCVRACVCVMSGRILSSKVSTILCFSDEIL